jgi:hypothetical protein
MSDDATRDTTRRDRRPGPPGTRDDADGRLHDELVRRGEDAGAATQEYDDLDADTVVEDAIEYFSDDPGPADTPASDTDAPPPG